MNEEIFRKKSLDKVKSPESLDNYIHVSNPRVWLFIISIIILLIGACIWGIFGHIDSTIPATIEVDNGTAVCYVSDENIASIQPGLMVKFSDVEATIESIGEKTGKGYVLSLTLNENPKAGFYEGEIIIARYEPISFVLN